MTTVVYFGRRDQGANSMPVGAGATFNLRVRLDNPAPAGGIPIGLNFQRFVNAGGVMIETMAISDPANTYFAPGGFPNPGSIPAGQREKVIGPFKVRADATVGGNQVEFPDDILFTAFVPQSDEDKHTSHVVTIIDTAARANTETTVNTNAEGHFQGTANNHDFHVALHAAIAAAKQGLGSTLIHWKLLDVTGEDGGIVQVTDLTVTIHAWSGPQP